MGGDEDLFHAIPQIRGKAAHTSIDENKYSSRKDEITGISVYSNQLGIAGKIDIYKSKEKLLIERKYQLQTIYQGQIYQLWGEYFCMTEMGYSVEKLVFYSMKDNKTFPIELPGEKGKAELMMFIENFKQFNPEQDISINENKCRHCIYCSLCDKINTENVYT
jgi:CRISPR-associated protein Cas4